MEAVKLVTDSMVIGLGTGSTAAYAIRAIGERVAQGLKIKAVPTSRNSEALARSLGIPITTLAEHPVVDLTIDGADAFDRQLNLIKGGGGALLREKIVAACSRRLVIIADSGKLHTPLGGFPLPVEVIKFGVRPVWRHFGRLNLNPAIRHDAQKQTPFITDEGNYIIDLHIDVITDPTMLAGQLRFPGVVEHGLFLGMAHTVLMGLGAEVKQFQR